jgi:hypothetical protein
VVRVWFCNQRQKQKRMKFAAQTGLWDNAAWGSNAVGGAGLTQPLHPHNQYDEYHHQHNTNDIYVKRECFDPYWCRIGIPSCLPIDKWWKALRVYVIMNCVLVTYYSFYWKRNHFLFGPQITLNTKLELHSPVRDTFIAQPPWSRKSLNRIKKPTHKIKTIFPLLAST